jgi:ribosome-binding factor A
LPFLQSIPEKRGKDTSIQDNFASQTRKICNKISCKLVLNSPSTKFVSEIHLLFCRKRNFLWLPPVLNYLCATFIAAPTSPFKNIIMETIRQQQVGELIRRYFGMILTEEGSIIYGRDKLVTVTYVKMTPDLLVAKIYISVYGTEHKQEVILQLENEHHHLRQALASKIGRQMRRLPDIEFFLDDTVDEMYRVQHLLDRVQDNDIDIQPK